MSSKKSARLKKRHKSYEIIFLNEAEMLTIVSILGRNVNKKFANKKNEMRRLKVVQKKTKKLGPELSSKYSSLNR